MSGQSLAIVASGMVTGVGLSAPAACAAIRCAIDNFQETRFMDSGGEWIMGCEVPLEQPWRGGTKLIKMAALAIQECIQNSQGMDPKATPLMLCLSEKARSGRVFDDDNQFFLDLQEELQLEFHHKSRIIAMGHVSITLALKHARDLLAGDTVKHVLLAGTDSLLVAPTLAAYEEKERLLTSSNSNGFIPGEAGAAVVVEAAPRKEQPQLICLGLGFGTEQAHVDSNEPLKADGLVAAIRESLGNADCELGDLDFRITDVSGEQYHFKEASLALSRILRKRKEEFDVWHPADCIGEVGAAAGPAMICFLKAANEKCYSVGDRILAHLGNDDGKRSAMVFAWQSVGGN